MRVLTKSEADAYSNALYRGGTIGGLVGLSGAVATMALLHRRFPAFRSSDFSSLKALATIYPVFLGACYGAENGSHRFENLLHPEVRYQDEAARMVKEARIQESISEKTEDWILKYRYPILGSTWLSTMAISLKHMRRVHYLFPTAQKLVQARVIAQAVTVAMLLATAALEVRQAGKASGKYETVEIFDMQKTSSNSAKPDGKE